MASLPEGIHFPKAARDEENWDQPCFYPLHCCGASPPI